VIYVLNGLLPGTAPPMRSEPAAVLGSIAELDEWSAFRAPQAGAAKPRCTVDTGMNRLGFPHDEAAQSRRARAAITASRW
jgi:alanine racemase